jgi:arylsulfatase
MALYDLRRDPAECYDVQEMYPEIVAQLNQIAQKARADLGDELTNSQGMGRRPVGKVD